MYNRGQAYRHSVVGVPLHQYANSLADSFGSRDSWGGNSLESFSQQLRAATQEPKKVFGAAISDVGVQLVEDAIKFIEAKDGIKEHGIIRISSDAELLKSLRKRVNNGEKINFSSSDSSLSVHAAADLIKAYLRELPEPLLTFELYEIWKCVHQISAPKKRMYHIKKTVKLLPTLNSRLLSALCLFLNKISQHRSINFMTLENLSIMFAPNFFRAKEETIETMMTDLDFAHELTTTLISEAVYSFKQAAEADPSLDDDNDAELMQLKTLLQEHAKANESSNSNTTDDVHSFDDITPPHSPSSHSSRGSLTQERTNRRKPVVQSATAAAALRQRKGVSCTTPSILHLNEETDTTDTSSVGSGSSALDDEDDSEGARILRRLGLSIDQFVRRTKDHEKGFVCKDRVHHLKLYRKCFVGREAVDWLMNEFKLSTRTEAVHLGNILLDYGEIEHIQRVHSFEDAKLFYQFRSKKRLIIVGGGFAGCRIAKKLETEYDVTLIDTKDHFLYLPSLPIVAVKPKHLRRISARHSSYLKRARVIVGEATQLHPDLKQIVVHDTKMGNDIRLDYDYIVLATGSSYDIPECIKGSGSVTEDVDPIYGSTSALDVGIVNSIDTKEITAAHGKLLSASHVTVVGGGFVGVELAAEIATRFPDKTVVIVSHSALFLERSNSRALHESVHTFFTEKCRNVIPMLDTTVTNVCKYNLVDALLRTTSLSAASITSGSSRNNDGNNNSNKRNSTPRSGGRDDPMKPRNLLVTVERAKADAASGERENYQFTTDLVYCCLGYSPNTKFLARSPKTKDFLNEWGQVKVNKFLQVAGYTDVFAVGDITDFAEEKLAQNAQAHADVLVQNIKRLDRSEPLHPYKYRIIEGNVFIISLGTNRAILLKGGQVLSDGMLINKMKGVIEVKCMVEFK